MYEITFITENGTDAKLASEQVGKMTEIVNARQIGEKPFAYPIGKAVAGFYTDIFVKCDGEKILEIEKSLRAEEKIIRFLIVKRKQVVKEFVKATERRESDRIKDEQRKATEEVVDEKKAVLPKKKLTEKPKIIKPKISEAERKKELDVSLDKLLKE